MDPFETTFGESDAFFGSHFGSGGHFERFNWHEDVNILYDMSLTFEESIFGGEQNIKVLRVEACEKCKGTGVKSQNAVKYCKDCDGKGRIMKTQRTPFGMVSQVSSCEKCKGIGKWIKDPCPSCHGEGTMQLKRNIKVHIPAGVYDGLVMQVKGEGHTDKRRGITGNIVINLHVKKRPGVRRKGLDLYSQINISYTDAILGTVLKVETSWGLLDIEIPPGTQPGENIKISSMGVPDIDNPSRRGHHYFTVNIEIPKQISDEERNLVGKLHSLSSHIKNQSRAGEYREKPVGKQKDPQKSGKSKFLWSTLNHLFRRKEAGTKFSSVSFMCLSKTNACPEYSCFWAFLVVLVTCCYMLLLERSLRIKLARYLPWSRRRGSNS